MLTVEQIRAWREDADYAVIRDYATTYRDERIIALADDLLSILTMSQDHFVTYEEGGWFIEHSLDCRLAGTLSTCAYNRFVLERGQTFLEGRFRIATSPKGRYYLVDDRR